MNVKIVVISVKESTQRRSAAVAQLDDLEADYDLMLVDRTMDISAPEYDRSRRMSLYGYDLLPGEVGCFLSHRQAWLKALDHDGQTLILEDDFVFDDKEAVRALISSPEARALPDIVRLQAIFEKPITVTGNMGPRQLVSFKGAPAGSTAMLVTKDGAARLLAGSEKFWLPVDDYIDNGWMFGSRVFGLVPYPISASQDEVSDIGERRRPNLSVLQKVKVEIARIPGQARKYLFKFRQRF